MATPKNGNLISLYLRPNGSTTAFKAVVCNEDLSLDATADEISRPTKCGTLKSAGTPSYEFGFSGVWDAATQTSTVSALELFDWFAAGTSLDVIFGDASSGATLLDFSGVGILTSCNINASAEDLISFECTLAISGSVTNNI